MWVGLVWCDAAQTEGPNHAVTSSLVTSKNSSLEPGAQEKIYFATLEPWDITKKPVSEVAATALEEAAEEFP